MKPFSLVTAGLIAAFLALAPAHRGGEDRRARPDVDSDRGAAVSKGHVAVEVLHHLDADDGAPDDQRRRQQPDRRSRRTAGSSPSRSGSRISRRRPRPSAASSTRSTPPTAARRSWRSRCSSRDPRTSTRSRPRARLFHLIPFLGSVLHEPLSLPPNFTQFTALPVKKGEVIGLTVPTWAPVLTYNLNTSKFSYRQSRRANCKNAAAGQTAQLAVGASTRYLCQYTGTRVAVQRDRGRQQRRTPRSTSTERREPRSRRRGFCWQNADPRPAPPLVPGLPLPAPPVPAPAPPDVPVPVAPPLVPVRRALVAGVRQPVPCRRWSPCRSRWPVPVGRCPCPWWSWCVVVVDEVVGVGVAGAQTSAP